MAKDNYILICVCLFGIFYPTQIICQCAFTDPKTGSHYVGECKTKTADNATISYPDGKGKETYTDGSYFVGNFSNGQRINGTYYYPSEAKYEGAFKNNEFDGNGIYSYESGRNEMRYEGAFKNGMYNGYGILTYKDGGTDDGLWKDDVFLGAKIGEYQKQDVLKKGDTIVVAANNNKYLLSRQTKSGGQDGSYGFLYPQGEFWFVHKTVEESNKQVTLSDLQTGQNRTFISENVIGFITQESANKYTFHNIDCDRTIYDKFTNYCNWETCRMGNSVNVFQLSYSDYEKIIEEDRALNQKIINNKLADIVVQVGTDTDFGLLGKIQKAIKGSGTAEKVIDALIKDGIDVNTSLQDKLRDDGVALLLSPLNDKEATSMAQQFAGCNHAIAVSFYNIISGENNETVGDKTIAEFIKELYRSKDYNSMETDVAKKAKIYRDALFGTFENCLPQSIQQSLKKNWFYYIAYNALKNSPEEGEAIGLFAANQVIKFKLAPEYKKGMEDHIANCRAKKEIVEKYRNEYQPLFEKNQDNCLGYTKVINQLKYEVNNPLEDENTQAELTLMKDYVFGNKPIPKCHILSTTELKPAGKNIQPQTQTNNTPFNGRTTKDYAAMAWMAYSDCPLNINDFSYLEIINTNSDSKYYTNVSTGYAGLAFLDKRDSTIIIAHRGTEFSWKDITADIVLKFDESTTEQILDANKFYDWIRKKFPTKTIEHTGHSLGGYLAQMLAWMKAEKAVVFESPGAEEVTKRLLKPKVKTANITNYSNNTVISSTGEQIGNTIYYSIPGHDSPLVPSLFGVSGYILELKTRHSIKTFYNEIIDNSTGEPKTSCLFQKTSTITEKPKSEPTEKKYLNGHQTITFPEITSLTSSSGDKFQAQPGDKFVGEMKDGKVVQGQGKVYRENAVIYDFPTYKRNF